MARPACRLGKKAAVPRRPACHGRAPRRRRSSPRPRPRNQLLPRPRIHVATPSGPTCVQVGMDSWQMALPACRLGKRAAAPPRPARPGRTPRRRRSPPRPRPRNQLLPRPRIYVDRQFALFPAAFCRTDSFPICRMSNRSPPLQLLMVREVGVGSARRRQHHLRQITLGRWEAGYQELSEVLRWTSPVEDNSRNVRMRLQE